MADNPLIRFLANKHGTGIAARATSTGNHQLAETTVNEYAVAGQVVPPEIAKQIEELNAITQQESLLAQTSGSARASLAGTGYDPVAIRKRAAELESGIINGSAIARNAAAAADLKMRQEQAQQLELMNNYTAATFDAKVDQDLAAFQLNAETNRDAISSIEDGRLVKTAEEHAYTTGKSIDDLYQVYAANDPALMTETFGTSDRRIAHGVLRHMQIVMNDDTNARVTGMTNAVTVQSYQLLNDPNVTTEQLMQMQAGALEIPQGVTRMAVDSAIADRMTQKTSANALVAAEAQGITSQAEYQKTVLSTLTAPNIAQIIASTLSAQHPDMQVDPGQVMEAIASGDIASVAASLMKATNNGQDMVTFPTVTGSQVEMPVQALLETLSSQVEAQQVRAGQQIQTQAQFGRYMQEVQENKRIAAATEGMLGVQIPSEVRLKMETVQSGAQQLYLLAAKAKTPEERALLEQEAMKLMDDSREELVRYAKVRGVPEPYLEDVRQGRFSSDATFGAAVVSMLDPKATNTPVARAFADLVRTKGVTTDELKAFAANPSMDNFNKIGEGWIAGPKISIKDVVATIDGLGFEVLSSAAIQEIDMNPAFDRLPAPALASVTSALESVTTKIASGDLMPSQAFTQLLPALRIADEMAYTAEVDAFKRGEIPQVTYVRGQLLGALAEGLNNKQVLQEFLAPGGRVDRGTAAALTLYNAGKTGGSTAGPNAMATVDLAGNAAMNLDNTLRIQMTGAQYSNIQRPLRLVKSDAANVLATLPEYASTLGFQTNPNDPAFQKDSASLELAIQMTYVDKLANPTIDQSKIPGTSIGLPSGGRGILGSGAHVPIPEWFGNTIARPEQIIANLRKLGNSSLADRLEAQQK